MELPNDMTFEQAIARLEEIVELLDAGDLPLNDSLKLFEEGVGLARECTKQLTEAQGKLESLVKKQDGTACAEELDL